MANTIELDCPPGYPRPGHLIDDVVKGTPLEGKVMDPVSTCFGCWTWEFKDISEDDWRKAQELTKPRITALYQRGVIRYGSW